MRTNLSDRERTIIIFGKYRIQRKKHCFEVDCYYFFGVKI